MTQETLSNVLESSTLEGDSPVGCDLLALLDFQSSVYWKLSVNMGDTDLQA